MGRFEGPGREIEAKLGGSDMYSERDVLQGKSEKDLDKKYTIPEQQVSPEEEEKRRQRGIEMLRDVLTMTEGDAKKTLEESLAQKEEESRKYREYRDS